MPQRERVTGPTCGGEGGPDDKETGACGGGGDAREEPGGVAIGGAAAGDS